MSKRSYAVLLSVGFIGAVGLGIPARAGVNFTNQGTGALGSWSTVAGDSIVYTSLATPATATTSQGNVTAASNATATAEVETFTPATSYTLAAIGVSASGASTATTISMHLYNVTSALSSNNGTVTQGSGATYSLATSSLTDLFSGLSFSNPAQGQAQLTFGLTGSDQVSLVAGNTYALEFWTPAGSGGYNWWRGAAVATDGQMMTAADALDNGTGASSVSSNFAHEDSRITIASAGQAGGAPRTAALALYTIAVPEPTSAAILCLGALASLSRRRRA